MVSGSAAWVVEIPVVVVGHSSTVANTFLVVILGVPVTGIAIHVSVFFPALLKTVVIFITIVFGMPAIVIVAYVDINVWG